jgi:hypothetical protein
MLVLSGALVASNLGWIDTARGQDARPTDMAIGPGVRLATYAFLPGERRSDILAWADKGVVYIGDVQALYDAVPDGPGSVVYINEEGIHSLSREWLRAKYATGVAFGGVGVQLSELGYEVGSNPDVPDLDPLIGEGKVQVSFSFEFSGNGRASRYYYTDYWIDLTMVPLLLERAIITSIE